MLIWNMKITPISNRPLIQCLNVYILRQSENTQAYRWQGIGTGPICLHILMFGNIACLFFKLIFINYLITFNLYSPDAVRDCQEFVGIGYHRRSLIRQGSHKIDLLGCILNNSWLFASNPEKILLAYIKKYLNFF